MGGNIRRRENLSTSLLSHIVRFAELILRHFPGVFLCASNNNCLTQGHPADATLTGSQGNWYRSMICYWYPRNPEYSLKSSIWKEGIFLTDLMDAWSVGDAHLYHRPQISRDTWWVCYACCTWLRNMVCWLRYFINALAGKC